MSWACDESWRDTSSQSLLLYGVRGAEVKQGKTGQHHDGNNRAEIVCVWLEQGGDHAVLKISGADPTAVERHYFTDYFHL